MQDARVYNCEQRTGVRRGSRSHAVLKQNLPLWILLLACVLSGCGYGLTPGRVKPGLESVAVPYFENETTEPELEVSLTDAIIAGIVADRTLRLTEENQADALILGKITFFKIQEVFFAENRQAQEYEVRVACEVSLVDRATGDVIVKPTTIRGKGDYFTDEGPEGEENARKEAADELVRAILALVIEEW
ncbi:MAG TPA: LPS assembly lipoprotein LptE [Candidatus Krumholzibacteria bacterium]|nr:LPS assembly lipoprotein LptE [Candidatus Krumholzibacteria bacterium]